MKSFKKLSMTVAEVICALLIFLFLYTAISKFRDMPTFESTLNKSLPIRSFAPALAWLIPVSEILIVLLLLFKSTRLTGIYCSMFALVLFTLYIIYMLLFVPNLPCSCGGVIQQMNWKEHLVFNIAFTVLSAMAINVRRRMDSSNIKKGLPAFHSTT